MINQLVKDWAWQVNDGMPDPKDRTHLEVLEQVLKDHKYSEEFVHQYISEIEFQNKDSFLKYKSKHKMRPTTAVTIGGKETTAGEADPEDKTKEKSEEPKKASDIIGDPKVGDNKDQLDMLANGFDGFKKATGNKPAPGNAGSAFNEIVSGQGVKMLHSNPNMSEEDLAMSMYKSFGETKLGQEQSKSPGTGKPPEGIKDPDAYSKCVIAARSAKSKFDNTNKRTKTLQESGKFGKPNPPQTFYGTAKSLKAQAQAIDKAEKVILPNGSEVSKEDAKEFVLMGGGGQNPSDTATFINDDKGNLMLQFHSDKSDAGDIQDNSTLKAESERIRSKVANNKNLNPDERRKSLKAIDSYNKKINDIEEGYNNQTIPVAKNLKSIPAEKTAEIIDKGTDMSNPKKSTLKKNLDAAVIGSSGVKKQYKKYLPKDSDENNLTTAQKYDMVRRLVADGKGLVKDVKVITKVGATIQDQMGDNAPEGIDVKKNLSDQREGAVDYLRERRDELNKIYPGPPALGDKQEQDSTISGFHLNMLDDNSYDSNEPDKNKRFKGIMDSSFDVNMGGVIVNKEVLRKALGVDDTKEFRKQFRIKESEQYTYADKEKTIVTGKRVHTILLSNKDGTELNIGYKTYRSKQGPTGNTGTTLQWSKDMQNNIKEAQ